MNTMFNFQSIISFSLNFGIYCQEDLLTTQLWWCYCTAKKGSLVLNFTKLKVKVSQKKWSVLFITCPQPKSSSFTHIKLQLQHMLYSSTLWIFPCASMWTWKFYWSHNIYPARRSCVYSSGPAQLSPPWWNLFWTKCPVLLCT